MIKKISPILKADHRGLGNRARESRPFHPDGLPLEFEVPMRARNIKPGFFDNEKLAALGPCAQILFEGLWCMADREGRLENRPARIKVKIFPYYEPFLGLTVNPPLNNGEPTVIERLIHQLTTLGFLTLYEVNGNHYIQIMSFLKHQRPHITEKQSQIPKIPEDLKITVDSTLDNVGNVPDSLIPDSLIPDSLIPDSLIPDSLIPDSKTLGADKPRFENEIKKIISFYHKILPMLPKVCENGSIPKSIKRRLIEKKERRELAWWNEYFTYVGLSDFLTGKKTDFKADLEWLIGPKNMQKVLNGRYHRDQKSGCTGLDEWVRINEAKFTKKEIENG